MQHWDSFSQEQFIIFDCLTKIIIVFQKQITWVTGQKAIYIKVNEIILSPAQFGKIFICVSRNYEYINFEPLLILNFRLNELIFEQKQTVHIAHLDFKFEQNQKAKIKMNKLYFGYLVWGECFSYLSLKLSPLGQKKLQRLLAQKFIGFVPIEHCCLICKLIVLKLTTNFTLHISKCVKKRCNV